MPTWSKTDGASATEHLTSWANGKLGLFIEYKGYRCSFVMANDPVLIAYAVKRGKKSRRVQYERIGRAYPHDTGEGLTIILDAMPVEKSDPDGMHIVLLELDESDDRRLLVEAKRYERERKAKGSKGAGKKERG
jgi:hypothetical protein